MTIKPYFVIPPLPLIVSKSNLVSSNYWSLAFWYSAPHILIADCVTRSNVFFKPPHGIDVFQKHYSHSFREQEHRIMGWHHPVMTVPKFIHRIEASKFRSHVSFPAPSRCAIYDDVISSNIRGRTRQISMQQAVAYQAGNYIASSCATKLWYNKEACIIWEKSSARTFY